MAWRTIACAPRWTDGHHGRLSQPHELAAFLHRPQAVANVDVYAGVTPVSVGGDSIGGSIVVRSADPAFAQSGEHLLKGEAGTSYRSNGNGWGGISPARLRPSSVSLDYAGAYTQSDNYGRAATSRTTRSPAGRATPCRRTRWAPPPTSPATSRSGSRGTAASPAGLHLRRPGHPVRGLCQPADGHDGEHQRPVQSRVHRRARTGEPSARAYYQHTEHEMDFGDDKRSGTARGSRRAAGHDTARALLADLRLEMAGGDGGVRRRHADEDRRQEHGCHRQRGDPAGRASLLRSAARYQESPGRLVAAFRRGHVALRFPEPERRAA